MEQEGDQLEQETFSCSICLDLLKDPVADPCGHSYCMKCIKSFWDEEDQKEIHSCPQCREYFILSSDLEINTFPDLLGELKKTGPQAAHDKGMKIFYYTDQQFICYIYPSKEHKDHDTVSAAAERAERQRELQVRREEIQLGIQDREKDVQLLQQEVEAISQSAERPLLRDTWTNTSLTATEVEVLLPQPEPKSRAGFLELTCELTLDPNTLNTWLLLSERNRKVMVMSKQQTYPSHPERFSLGWQVLSSESLTGRHYWEVEWRGLRVYVAVAYKNISRTGSSSIFGHNDKSWALDCYKNSYTYLHNNIWTFLSGPRSSRIGVFLDHSAGVLSFYSVSDTMTLLHRVQTRFTQPLHAGLWISNLRGDSAGFCKLK